MSTITIYHNPKCGTSRNALALIRECGHEPQIVEDLKTPPTRETLAQLQADSGLSAREFIRSKEALYTELGLDAPTVSDEQLLDAMAAHPILIERPLDETDKGVRLGRPPETIREIL